MHDTVNKNETHGVLGRLLADQSGNVLMMFGAAIFPLMAMVGGGVDISRAYVAKTRLQQACDAGVLATRRSMNGDIMTSNDIAVGDRFFNVNLPQQSYGAKLISHTISQQAAPNAGTVSGTARIVLPTVLMQIFGKDELDISTTCSSKLDIGNTDVVLVLDTTGSMLETISDGNGGSQTKIAALRLALKDFHDVLGPGGGNNGRIRYGFVPYTSSVNVGYVIPVSNLIGASGGETATYRSRSLASGFWNYGNTAITVSPFINGASAANPVYSTNAALNGDILGNTTYSFNGNFTHSPPSQITWQGCIEERNTVNTITSSNTVDIPSSAFDLQVNTPATNAATKWKPLLPELIYYNGWPYSATKIREAGYGACPSQARKLATYATRTSLPDYGTSALPRKDPSIAQTYDQYVDSLQAIGGTYHDIGMVWGARFLSANSVFGSENADTFKGRPVAKHIVFMTDGNMSPNSINYTAWGINANDGRVAPSGTNDTALTAIHNRRLDMICNGIRNMTNPPTIWVVTFGSAVSTQLQNCASAPSGAYRADTSAQLKTQFGKIARSIGGLRLSS